MPAVSMIQKLNAQINREFYASHLCLHLSAWCAKNSLTGSANFLRSQAQNNVTHMMRVFNFMKQSGGMPSVGTISPPDCHSLTLEELFQQTLDDHHLRHETLTMLKEEAKAVNAGKIVSFLMALELEQDREGERLQTVLEEVRNAKKAGLCMSQTDRRVLSFVEHGCH
ncbi:non-heme ferritin-like protein [Cedecea neteri]|uniref:non-heme ferritin-like protein n=1 Tax=Cedecea neteri TaxID=158822 RepID=UPI002AA6FF7E|nr:non-heme ferritin-like protein [Cedecea neteri]WPU24899.1 non-heme ferritin-like protein [Cedecea neteri]